MIVTTYHTTYCVEEEGSRVARPRAAGRPPHHARRGNSCPRVPGSRSPTPCSCLARAGRGSRRARRFARWRARSASCCREREGGARDQRRHRRSQPDRLRPPGGESNLTPDFADPAGARRLAAGVPRGARCRPALLTTTSDAVLEPRGGAPRSARERVNLVGSPTARASRSEYLRRRAGAACVARLVLDASCRLSSRSARSTPATSSRRSTGTSRSARRTQPVAASSARRASGSMRCLAELRESPRPVRYRDPLTDAPREDELTAAVGRGRRAPVRLRAAARRGCCRARCAEAATGHPEVLMAQARMIESLIGEADRALGPQLSVSLRRGRRPPAASTRPDAGGTLMGTEFVAAVLGAVRGVCRRAAGAPPTSTRRCRTTGPRAAAVRRARPGDAGRPLRGEAVVKHLPRRPAPRWRAGSGHKR